MAQWLPPEDMEVVDVVDRLGAEIAGMYADAENRLLNAIRLQVQAGLDHERASEMLARIQDLRTAAQEIVTELENLGPQAVDDVIQAAISGGAQAAIAEMAGFATAADITAATVGIPGAMAANLMKADLYSSLEKLHMRILRYPDDVYRRMVGQSATDAILGLTTNRQAQQKAWSKLLGEGITGFVDVSGRKWNLATYTEMATRTAVMRSWDDAHNVQLQSFGQDLVTPVVEFDACEKCARWIGKILALTGTAGTRELEHITEDGVFVRVKVDATVEGAREEGFKHPNCVCKLEAYLPGLSVPMGAVEYDEEQERNREDLRAAERAVRKAKRDQATALDPVSAEKARNDLNKARAEIRRIVDETPQLRKRYREQPNLGNRRVA